AAGPRGRRADGLVRPPRGRRRPRARHHAGRVPDAQRPRAAAAARRPLLHSDPGTSPMEPAVRDDLERRLRASRPDVPDDPVDEALLERVRALPVERRRRGVAPRLAPVAVLAAVIAASVVLLTGGPGGPPSASALTQAALQWFTPPAGTILHVRS